ncbi:MAG: monovalent cation/H+ antiporter subunit D family protein [Hyphomicrobiales bacterium]|nr:monovalent cation/H+ antiporter subunit D family protein [Hyphomicrobiales bacterium]
MLMAIIVVLPFLGALLIALAGKNPNLREFFTLATGVTTFLLVLNLLPGVFNNETTRYTFAEPFPGLTLQFSLEPLGMIFALMASFLWVVTSIYSIGYMRGNNEQNQTRFYVGFAVAIAFTLGLAFSANLLTLFVFYEMLTISTYPLVTHAGTDHARKGGRVYLGILLTTSIALFLPAMIWTYHSTGTLDFRPGGIFAEGADKFVVGIILLLFFFGVGKAALMPFHRWLPAAMVAPTPVSALLHAVAVVKAGVFTVLKIAVYIFGIDLLASLEARDILLYVAGGGVLLASLIAMRQNNLKARLAYSTVSQLGYVTLGALLATQAGVTGASMHIVMHAFGKITLFFCAGAIYVASRKTEINDMVGLGRTMPFTMAAFTIGALSVVGLPPTGGTWSKWYLMQGTLESGHLILMGVLMVSSLLNIAYLLPIPVRGFFNKTGNSDGNSGIKEAPRPILLAIAITVSGCILLFIFPQALYDLATMVR